MGVLLIPQIKSYLQQCFAYIYSKIVWGPITLRNINMVANFYFHSCFPINFLKRSYCWWFRNPAPVEAGSLSHYHIGFYTSQVIAGFLPSAVLPVQCSLLWFAGCHFEVCWVQWWSGPIPGCVVFFFPDGRNPMAVVEIVIAHFCVYIYIYNICM